MEGKRIQLPPNQHRHLTSVLRIVERNLNELERNVLYPVSGKTFKREQDLTPDELETVYRVIEAGRKQISEMVEKYQIQPEIIHTRRFLNSRKAKIWEVLADSLTKKLKGYGTFPEKFREEFDQDIGKLDRLLGEL